MKRFVMAVCAVALGLLGLTVTGSAATAQVAALPNCQHAEGDGGYRSAGPVLTFSEPSADIGSVQLCKDSSSRYWGYMVLRNPLPAGRWANVYIEAYYDREYRARFSCEGRNGTSEGNKHIKQGETMCWTPKMLGSDTRWTYYVYGRVCIGAFDDTSRCYAEGHTYFTYR